MHRANRLHSQAAGLEGAERKESAKITDTKLAQAQDAIDLVDGNLKPKEGGINKTIVNEEPKVGITLLSVVPIIGSLLFDKELSDKILSVSKEEK